MRHQISFPAALWATCTLSILPVFAQSSVQETPINPTASLTRAASGHLVIAGQPFQRALLLVGQCGTPPGGSGGRIEGQRVLPLGQTWIDCDGNGRAQILIQQASCPVFAQLWTPPGPNAATPAGSWSLLCVSFPSGGQINSTAKPGDLVVTEFMKDPTDVTDSHGEWIEVRNMLPWRLDIAGVVLSDASGASFVFDNGGRPLYLRPHEYFVVGNDDAFDANGGVEVDWKWSGFSLRNSNDEIYFHDRFGALLDKVEYDDGVLWPDTPGRSISLKPTAMDGTLNDAPAHWCHSSSVASPGNDSGTPGAINDTCP
ncbi:MAG: lamin tail domain-containing protein [bacterium]|jgi:hypothetical protein|nr:lamin tail domain-containing protein [Planctomycetota bacterium]HIL50697.1 lamin tail domain-containing protein [Planctomycetota bacterium]